MAALPLFPFDLIFRLELFPAEFGLDVAALLSHHVQIFFEHLHLAGDDRLAERDVLGKVHARIRKFIARNVIDLPDRLLRIVHPARHVAQNRGDRFAADVHDRPKRRGLVVLHLADHRAGLVAFRTHQREPLFLNAGFQPGDLLFLRVEADAVGGKVLRLRVLPRNADHGTGHKFIILELEAVVRPGDDDAFLRVHVNMLAVVGHAQKELEFGLRHRQHRRILHRTAG